MSIYVIAAVMGRRFGSTTRKAVAIKLADCANDDGSKVYPSIKRLSSEAEVSESTARRTIQFFVSEGLLVLVEAGGKGPGDTTEYRFDMAKLAALPLAYVPEDEDGHPDHLAPEENEGCRGDTHSPAKGVKRTSKGVTDDEKGCQAMTPDPSFYTRPLEPRGISEKQKSRQPDNDLLHRQAYLKGLQTKSGTVAKSSRSNLRVVGELDGSHGVTFTDGKLSLDLETTEKLRSEYPGVDVASVCDRAGPDLCRMNYPSRIDALVVLRKWARIALENKKTGPAKSNGLTRREIDLIVGVPL